MRRTLWQRSLRIKLRLAAIVAAAVVGGLAGDTSAADPQRRPNIIVIVADDLGYGDLGIQGGTDIPTPHIDSLARDGVRCTNGYVSCPVCSPTRAGLLTSRYQQRFGHEFNPGPAPLGGENGHLGLPLDQVTLANVLKKAGYKTGMVGKWHLGFDPQYQPQQRGFDEFFGFLGGAHQYFPGEDKTRGPIYRGTEIVEEKEYLTDAFAREAVAYIQRHSQEPFFLYLTFNAVHNPLEAPEKYLERFPNISDAKRKPYAAMLSALDDGVGQVLKTLADRQLTDNTLVFFVSDNGGPTAGNGSRNTPLNGNKGSVWEGGIRVPYLVKWPGHVPAGKTYEQPVIALDIGATAAVAAGTSHAGGPAIDGVNLLPFFTGESQEKPHSSLYWRYGPQWAVRQGDYKLLKIGDQPPQLFNLQTDIGEQRDLAGDKPELVARLQSDFDGWNSELAKPLWETQRRRQRSAAGPRRLQREAAAAAAQE